MHIDICIIKVYHQQCGIMIVILNLNINPHIFIKYYDDYYNNYSPFMWYGSLFCFSFSK